MLWDHKTAIGWIVADIKGINPSICMHKILLEEKSKLVRETRRKLNPAMMEVVKKEVIKLLCVRIIYPISDSKWVPKKTRMTMIKNQDDELVSTKVLNGWRCVSTIKNSTL